MSIQRSKSAPQLVSGTSTVHVPRSYSYENVHCKSTRVPPLHRPLAPLASPSSRIHRGDPFSLGNFFPTSRLSDEDDWNWLDAIDEEPEATSASTSAFFDLAEDRVAAEDKYAAEAIRSEDKLGILSFGRCQTCRRPG